MKAVRIHKFGPPKVVVVEDIPKPSPGKGEVLVRVAAAGVAPWDATIREGKSKVSPQPPLTLGSDLSGFVEAVGPDVSQVAIGDEVYGVTNPQFCGAQAEFAVAIAGMIAPKPRRLNHLEAASAPVIAVTASQMLFEYGQAKSGDTILITGAAGNVGAYAVQMALEAGIRVIAVARCSDQELLRAFGVETILDSGAVGFETSLPQVDAVLDTVGGETVQRCSAAVRPGGRLVSVASTQLPQRAGMQSVFFYAEVTSERLRTLRTCLRRARSPPGSGQCCRWQKRVAHTRCLPVHLIKTAKSFCSSSAESKDFSPCRSPLSRPAEDCSGFLADYTNLNAHSSPASVAPNYTSRSLRKRRACASTQRHTHAGHRRSGFAGVDSRRRAGERNARRRMAGTKARVLLVARSAGVVRARGRGCGGGSGAVDATH